MNIKRKYEFRFCILKCEQDMNIKRELRCSVRPILATTWLESCKKGIQCGRQGIGPGQNDQNIV